MSDADSSGLNSMRIPVNAAALLLVAVAGADWLGNVYTLRFGSVQWRYGAFGLLVNGMPPVVVGMLIGGLGALYYQRPLAARLWATLSFLVSVVLLAGVMMFALDTVQMRATVTPDRVSVFRIGVAVTVGKAILDSIILILLGRGVLRGMPKDYRRTREPTEVIIGKA